MSFFSSLDTSASGLTAQRLRMDIISQNIANVNTTKTAEGGPYKRKTVIFQERNDAQTFAALLNQNLGEVDKVTGVRVSEIVEDNTSGSLVYEPSHPDADDDGYVRMPNVNIVEEMVNMISANRSYEANITAINTTKAMAAKTLEISK